MKMVNFLKRTGESKKVAYSVSLLTALFFPFICFCFMELCHPRSPISWLFEYVISRFGKFALSWVVLSLVMLIILALTRRIWISCAAVGFLFFAATFSNYYKLGWWNVPVLPGDLKNIVSGLQGIGLIGAVPTKRMWLFLAFLIIFVVMISFVKIPKPNGKYLLKKSCIVIVLIVCLVVYFGAVFVNENGPGTYDVKYIGTFADYYYQNTFFTGFFSRAVDQLFIYAVPENYNQETIDIIADEIDVISNSKEVKATPDIIVILLETYYDFDVYGIEYDAKIDKNFSNLSEEGISGTFISPQLGGGTANVEFEVLTGIATNNDYINSIAYNENVFDGMPNIVSYLQGKGYETLAMHSYKNELFNRENAYRSMGFQNSLFISDYKLENARYANGFLSDCSSMEELERVYEGMTAQTEGGVFINLVTMQNHGPYNNTFSELDGYEMVNVISDRLVQDEIDQASAVASLIKLTDDSIGEVVDYFKQVDRDVILVFYGDHQTAISSEINQAIGYPSGYSDLSNEIMQHETRYLVWSNFESKPGETFGAVPANLLLPYVLNTYKAERPAYFDWMLQNSAEGRVKGISGNLILYNDGSFGFATGDVSELDEYFALLYDIKSRKLLLGEAYMQ